MAESSPTVVTLVPKHNQGSFTANLPLVTDAERIQKHATGRFMNKNARFLMKKFSGGLEPSRNPSSSSSSSPASLSSSSSTSFLAPVRTAADARLWTRTVSEKHIAAVRDRPSMVTEHLRITKVWASTLNVDSKAAFADADDEESPLDNTPQDHRQKLGPLSGTTAGFGTKVPFAHSKWVKVYEDKVASIAERARAKRSERKWRLSRERNGAAPVYDTVTRPSIDSVIRDVVSDTADVHSSTISALATQEIVTSLRVKTKTFHSTSVDRAGAMELAMLQPPRFFPPQPLPPTAIHSKYCGTCFLGVDPPDGNRNVFSCEYCSAVYHPACFDGKNYVSGSVVCGGCLDELDASRKHYEDQRVALYELRLQEHYATLIAGKWKAVVARSRYRTMRKFLVSLQAMARAFRLRRAFKFEQRTRSRAMKINLVRGIDFPIADWDNQKADPYVITTIHDDRGRQVWRFESAVVYDDLNPQFNEEFLVPGVSGACKIVFTVVDKDEVRDQFIGQCVLQLNPKPSVDHWVKGGRFCLALDECLYMPKNANGSDFRMDFGTIIPTGFIEIDIVPCAPLTSMCGFLMGPPLDDESLNATFAVADVSKCRKCWCALVDNKMFVYYTYGAPSPKLILDLKHCDIQIDTQIKDSPITITNRVGTEFKFFIAGTKDRDLWRTAIECTYDLHFSRRNPKSIERIQAAIDLMRRRNRPKISIKLPRRAGGKKQWGKKESTSRHNLVSAGTVNREDVTLSAMPEGGRGRTRSISMDSGADDDDNDDDANSVLLPPLGASPSRKKGSGHKDDTHGSKKLPRHQADSELVAAFKPKNIDAKKPNAPEKPIKFPALQRKASVSSALFGQVEHKPNAQPVKEFKFNSSMRGSKSGTNAGATHSFIE